MRDIHDIIIIIFQNESLLSEEVISYHDEQEWNLTSFLIKKNDKPKPQKFRGKWSLGQRK